MKNELGKLATMSEHLKKEIDMDLLSLMITEDELGNELPEPYSEEQIKILFNDMKSSLES